MFSRTRLFSKLFMIDNVMMLRKESLDAKSYSSLFFEEDVQQMLQKITNVDLEKVFKPKPRGKPLRPYIYKFLTTEELEEEQKKAKKKLRHLLQMPPVLKPREDINDVLSVDSALDGHDLDHAKFVFSDISFDMSNEERPIVVREPNGVLRKANWGERHRINQIFNPLEGRNIYMPKMFEDKHLEDVLNREEYIFILDRACIQFEPNDPIYIKVTAKTYETINERSHFERLHSTRHFGSLAFYLIINKNIDNMLINNIESDRIDDAYTLIQLYHKIHPDCESTKHKKDYLEALEAFIKLDSKKKEILQLTLQTYLSKNDSESAEKSSISN